MKSASNRVFVISLRHHLDFLDKLSEPFPKGDYRFIQI